MGMQLKERMSLSNQAVKLGLKLGDKSLAFSQRLQLGRERTEILAKLSAGASSAVDSSETVDTGNAFLATVGYKKDEGARSRLSDAIRKDSRINEVIDAQSWSKPEKKRVLEMAATATRSYDVYKRSKADLRSAARAKINPFYIYEGVNNLHKEVYQQVGSEAMHVVDSLLSTSPMADSAKRKALESDFDAKAKNRISRQRKGSYTGSAGRQNLLNDTAGFYQLVAFDSKPINFTVRNARQDYRFSDRTISVGEGFTKKVLWHELAHSLEDDHPEVLEMAISFLKKRLTDSNGVRPLPDIYQDLWNRKQSGSYSSRELTIDDGGFSPYVTKFYNTKNPYKLDGASATEVISMGVEALTDSESLGKMIVNDHEHFEFIVGVVQHLQQKYKDKNDDDKN
ncbi:hypothetical protein [Vibrio marisflavi]|uniref:Uncharacterized protein n=1 Tax=Vibrio marisflavi CECT 7928 TaxID=634439 RepID=A0ABM9A990_9VIBR|nr:hypothetical protein [Vibrio marisflavi]CAH0543100.1 hypothetical protein VMF7928_04400 [Vibrio marisflavi CECT 7928]